MKNTNGIVVSTVQSIRNKAVGILAVFACMVAIDPGVHGQCTPSPLFINQAPTVVGTAGALNTKYRRTNVIPGVDVEFKIDSIYGGATLRLEDVAPGTTNPIENINYSGYAAAWQPVLNTPNNTTAGEGGIRWFVSFFVNGSNFTTPYTFNCISLMGVDVDGDGSQLKEFVQVSNPYSFAGSSTGTTLNYSSNTGRLRATARDATGYNAIDSTRKSAMVVFRYKNITNFRYTTGFIKGTEASVGRQFCLFFGFNTNFPSPFSRFYDTDGDGVSDINDPTDLDDDNDGIADLIEYPADFPDPLLDADNDGLTNYEDPTPGSVAQGIPATFTWVDTNGDGINDRYDADKDGIINSLDRDSDNDGIPDLVEAGGTDTNGDGVVDFIGTFASNDTDGDGLLDRYDASETNPNVTGVALTRLDSDGDGIPNILDLDSDNDGIPDVAEVGGVDANGDGRIDNFVDNDTDGLCDLVDGDVGDDGVVENGGAAGLVLTGTYISTTNPAPVNYLQGLSNTDARGLPNFLDLDSDDDGLSDVKEAGGTDANYDGIIDYTGSFASNDTDGDGFVDSVDGNISGSNPILKTCADTNNDGKADSYPVADNADGTGPANPYDMDSDDDGVPDIIECGGVDQNGNGRIDGSVDTDNDGWVDTYDPNVSGGINLVLLDANGATAGGLVFDFDGDGIPNYLDLDSDNDGIPDILEQGGADANNDGKVDTYADIDKDGFADIYDPQNNITGAASTTLGTALITAATVGANNLPTVYTAGASQDGTGLINMLDLDADDDGILDTRESGITTSTSTQLDTNNDGVINSGDTGFADANGDGWADAVKALASYTLRNTDGIGKPNYLDIDSDDDGIPDNIEGQATAGYVTPAGADTDFDGIDNAYDNNSSVLGGNANNGIALADTDGDGISDYRDLDSDNDGKSDRIEGWDTNGNGIIDGSEKAYVGTNDTDGDGLLDEYDAVSGTANPVTSVTNNTTPTSYPDVNNPGGNRDWREIVSCSGNMLTNASFELPVQSGNGNHIFGLGAGIPGWRVSSSAAFNIIVPSSSYLSGPNAARTGNQYLEINNSAGVFTQIFDLTCSSSVSFGGSFSAREPGGFVPWTGKIEIMTLNGTVVATSATRNFTVADADNSTTDAVWYQLNGGSGTLPAGRYIFKVTMGDYGNFDDAYLCVTGCYKYPDADGDGVGSVNDVDDDNDGITDLVENGGFDAYGDGDNDGIPNYTDATPGTGLPAFVDANNDGINDFYDSDKDGIINSEDLDSDSDGIPDLVEAGGIDADGNGSVDFAGSFASNDSDGDGLINTYDASTGGTNIANLDTDLDGIPNSKDLDSDNDGYPDVTEAGGADANNDGKLDGFTDTDNDGLADSVDGDVGNDGIAENTAGALIITSATGTNGRPASYPRANQDGTGLPNPYDLDSDGDGIPDIREANITDSNGDGVLNSADAGYTDTNGDGWSDQVDNLATFVVVNTDGRGKPNFLDIDSDDDGIVDNIEAQSTAGYIAPTGTDTDGDGLDNAYDNVNTVGTFGGNANNGVFPVNTDGADRPDYTDLDSDNDGYPDFAEGHDFVGDNRPHANSNTKNGVPGGTTDADGDGLLDGYDNNTASPDPTNKAGTTAVSPNNYPNIDGGTTERDWREAFNTDKDAVVSNLTDIDDDNDGVPDITECGGYDPLGDADSDGIPNYLDPTPGNGLPAFVDANGDGINDAYDADKDGIINSLDLDSDNDGIADIVEAGGIDSNGDGMVDTFVDTNNNGLADIYDPAATVPGTSIANLDTDGDGIPNTRDLDSDNDGIPDLIEAGGIDTNKDGIIDAGYADADGDGFADSVDGDVGNDGVAEGTAKALIVTSITGTNGRPASYTRANADANGLPNPYDLDSDDDGIADIVEAGGIDANGDGRVDYTGTFATNDTDGDGLVNTYDVNATGGAAIASLDSDGDGIANAKDLDSDNDGVPDIVEAGGTDANNNGKVDNTADTDGDGLADIVDGDVGNDGTVEGLSKVLIYTGTVGTTAGVPAGYPRANADGMGLPNPYDLDSDGDGILDARESGLLKDLNNDGVLNTADGAAYIDVDGNGWVDIIAAIGSTILTFTNTDALGGANYLDIDSDDDGITDNVEGQATYTYKLPLGTDADNDGIDDAYDNNTAVFGGNSSNGITPVNTDNTDLADYLDTDSDNDNMSDLKEGYGDPGYVLPNTTDTDGDGLLDAFDSFNLSSITGAMQAAMQSNITMKFMGANGSYTANPTLFGSNDRIYKTSTIISADRDWRNAVIILPVKLISFTAGYSNKVAGISWTTANEDGHEHYLLERSIDGVNFQAVSAAVAKGTATSNYTYADNAVPAVSIVYYRLQMVNADGSVSYSKVVAIRLSTDKLNLSIYPNPVVDQVSISFASTTAQVVNVKVFNMQGAQVTTRVYKAQAGANTLQLTNWSKLPAGDYLIEVSNDNFKMTQKLTHVH